MRGARLHQIMIRIQNGNFVMVSTFQYSLIKSIKFFFNSITFFKETSIFTTGGNSKG